jgi:hypothetical protein
MNALFLNADFKGAHGFPLVLQNTVLVLQRWGDYADMGQAVAIYVLFCIDVLLICWFGDQLTQHVRENGLLFLFLLLLLLGTKCRRAFNKLGRYSCFDPCNFLCSFHYTAAYFFWSKIEKYISGIPDMTGVSHANMNTILLFISSQIFIFN